jgi:hypothetical protein
MLEAHAPHGRIHGWRDFLIHIVAIAIGLLLALGLEQIVQYTHERRELSVARRELSAELEENQQVLAKNMAELRRVQQALDTDLKIVQALRAHQPPAGGFDYSVQFFAVRDGPWQAIRQNGSLSLMPDRELQNYVWFHEILTYLMETMHAFESAARIGDAVAASALPDKMSPHDLDQLAGQTLEAQGRLKQLHMFLQIEQQGLQQLAAEHRSNP